MLRKRAIYIFLITFLLLLIVTLSIIAVNLHRQVKRQVLIQKEEELQQTGVFPIEERTPETHVSPEEEEFIKKGLKPREAKYYE